MFFFCNVTYFFFYFFFRLMSQLCYEENVYAYFFFLYLRCKRTKDALCSEIKFIIRIC